jgi:hypothetical protein
MTPTFRGLLAAIALAASSGCCPPDRRTTLLREVEAAARPILSLDPAAVWTDCYNQLLDHLPYSIEFLAEQPRLLEQTSADDLSMLVHLSLLRLLIHPAARPRLTATCLETTLDLLHFDLKVGGRPLGTVVMSCGQPPRAWHQLYPADFDHERACAVDVEADRRAVLAWWRENRTRLSQLAETRRLSPQAEHLWQLLSRRQADRWVYEPPRTLRCSQTPGLFAADTCDYNLVRAACAWLGSRPDPQIRDRLIELVASGSQIVAHNALVALRYSPDERIRKLLQQYQPAEGLEASPAVPAGLAGLDRHTVACRLDWPIARASAE